MVRGDGGSPLQEHEDGTGSEERIIRFLFWISCVRHLLLYLISKTKSHPDPFLHLTVICTCAMLAD